MTPTNRETSLRDAAERLRRDKLYVILGANLLLLVSVVLPELGYDSLLVRTPGLVGLAIGSWWWYRVAVRDLSRTPSQEIFNRVVDDD